MKGLTPIFIIIIAVLGAIFYLRPQYAEIVALRTEAASYDATLAKVEQFNSLRLKLEKTLESISASDLDKLGKLIPETVDFPRLALDLTSLAANYGIELESLSFEAAENAPQRGEEPLKLYKSSTIAFNVSTSYEVMIAFLRELEQSLRMFDVTGLQLSPAEDATGAYTFAVTMETYWVDETAAKASQQAAVDNLQNI